MKLLHRPAARVPLWTWFAADQAMSSVTNLGLVVALANTLDVRTLSGYVLLISIQQLCIGVARTVVGEERLAGRSRHVGPSDDTRALMAGGAVGIAVVVAAAVVGAVISGPQLSHAMVFGAALPFVFLQDTLRYRALAGPRPWLALLSDGVWLAVSTVVLGGAAVAGRFGAGAAVLAWSLGGVVASLSLAACRRHLGEPRTGRPDAGDPTPEGSRSREARLAFDYVLSRGITDLSLIVLAVLGAAEAVAGMKGAQLLAAPALLLVATWRSLVLRIFGPTGVTAVALARVRRIRWVVAGVAGVAVAVPALAPRLAELALDEAAASARVVGLFFVAMLVSRVVMLGEYGALRALGESEVILRSRLVGSLLIVPAVAVAALADSGVPVAVSLAAVSVVQALMYRAQVQLNVTAGGVVSGRTGGW